MTKAFGRLRAGLALALACAAAAAFDLGRGWGLGSLPPLARVVGPLLLPALALAAAPAAAALSVLPRRRLLAVLLAAGFLPRLLSAAFVDNRPVSDFAVYQEMSRALLSGQGFALTGPAGLDDLRLYLGQDKALPYATAYRAPGAPLVGAALGADARLFKLLNAALGTATGLLLFLLLEPLSRPGAVAAALLWSFYPAAVLAGNLYGSEAPFVFLLALIAWLIERSRPAAAGLAAAAACLFRPLLLPLMVAAAGAWLLGRPKKEGARALALFAVVLALGLSPWTLRNWLLFKRFIPVSTSEGIVFGIHSAFHLPAGARADPELKQRWARFHIADEPARAAQGYRLGFFHLGLALKAGPSFFARRLAVDIADSFGSDLDMIMWATAGGVDFRPRAPTAVVPVVPALVLAALAVLDHAFYVGLMLLAVWALWRGRADAALRSSGLRFLFVYFLCSFAVFAAVPGVSRYHFPLMLPVAALAALAVQGERA